MYIKIKEIEDALEAAYIRSVLDDKNIPYNIAEYSDSAYKGFLETKYGFGILEAPLEFKERIWELIDSKVVATEKLNYESELVEKNNPPSSASSSSKIITTFLFFSTLAFAFLYIKKNNELKHINEHPLFTYEWDSKTNSTQTRWKKNGKLNYVDVDNNLNFISEKTFAYDIDENLTSESYDEDENGWHEKVILYDAKGKATDIYNDLDDNFGYDKETVTINDSLFLLFTDTDNDRFWNTISFLDIKGAVKKTMTYQEYEKKLIEISEK